METKDLLVNPEFLKILVKYALSEPWPNCNKIDAKAQETAISCLEILSKREKDFVAELILEVLGERSEVLILLSPFIKKIFESDEFYREKIKSFIDKQNFYCLLNNFEFIFFSYLKSYPSSSIRFISLFLRDNDYKMGHNSQNRKVLKGLYFILRKFYKEKLIMEKIKDDLGQLIYRPFYSSKFGDFSLCSLVEKIIVRYYFYDKDFIISLLNKPSDNFNFTKFLSIIWSEINNATEVCQNLFPNSKDREQIKITFPES